MSFELIGLKACALGVAATLFALPEAVLAQEQSLSSQASDPTASLMSFQLQDFYSYNLTNSEDELNIAQFRAAIPFTIGGVNNIARLTLPYITQSASGDTGWSDATLFNVAAFDRKWGRIGVGAVALLPTGSDGLGAEKWGLGPALGAVARPSWGLLGVFNQNIFTVAGNNDRPDVNLSTLQPIVTYSLADGWSVGSSDMTLAYDWDANEFTSIPLGIKVSKMTKPGGVPIQWQLSYEHNFYDKGVGPQDTLGFTAKLLLPK